MQQRMEVIALRNRFVNDWPVCDLIALDVEGYEFRALQGAARTVELFRPTIIWERKHGGRYSGDHLALPEWLKARGYTHRDTVERDEIWS